MFLRVLANVLGKTQQGAGAYIAPSMRDGFKMDFDHIYNKHFIAPGTLSTAGPNKTPAMRDSEYHKTLLIAQKRSTCRKGKPTSLYIFYYLYYSHSIVAGGLPVMSNTTRLMPLTSFTMREAVRESVACGMCV